MPVRALIGRAARQYMAGKWFAFVVPFGDGRLRSKAGRRFLRDVRRKKAAMEARRWPWKCDDDKEHVTQVITGYGKFSFVPRGDLAAPIITNTRGRAVSLEPQDAAATQEDAQQLYRRSLTYEKAR